MIKTLFKYIVPKFSSIYYLLLAVYEQRHNILHPFTIRKEFRLLQKLKTESQDSNRFSLEWKDRKPALEDKTNYTPFDHHYIYHPAWAARILARTNPKLHIDISSTLYFCTLVSAFIPIEFYDFRPAKLDLDNLKSQKGDLNKLPFDSDSVGSISCMHTIEHIGLGRYGDTLDFDGDIKAINELLRVTKKNGDILFVTPVGIPKIVFNAHRVYSYSQILDLFSGCRLVEFTLVADNREYIVNASEDKSNQQKYGCGCFWFKKN